MASGLLALMLFLTCVPCVEADGLTVSVPQSERIVYGYSGENRPLEAYRFGTGPNVLVFGFAIHGYEDNFARDGQCLVECAYALMDYLSECYLVDGYGWTVYILPCMNPDGLLSGYTNNGPGRCTTTYLTPDGQLATDGGIDLNRSFPAGFIPQYYSRNRTTATPMSSRESIALDAFLRQIMGEGKNILIDVHGWLQSTIFYDYWLANIFQRHFWYNSPDYAYRCYGYLIRHARSLGYESVLLELPRWIRSLEQFRRSDITDRVIASLEDILLCGTPKCGGTHTMTEEYIAPTCDQSGHEGTVCTQCGFREGSEIDPLGHTPDGENPIHCAPSADSSGALEYLCTVCGAVLETELLANPLRSTDAGDTMGDAALNSHYIKVRSSTDHAAAPYAANPVLGPGVLATVTQTASSDPGILLSD